MRCTEVHQDIYPRNEMLQSSVTLESAKHQRSSAADNWIPARTVRKGLFDLSYLST
uniref:Uncharacterized protein n=1 Tax=Arundo donax TaxID=35708 RepID=A0A0A9F556_ARUDO